MELVIFIGLQAAGKTTFYHNNFAATHQHISKDLFPNNKNKNRRQTQLITAALEEGKSVVIDNTNPTSVERALLIEIGNSYNCKIIGYYFDLPLNLCLERNQQRIGKAKVPEIGIFATVKKLTRPSYSEGFDYLFDINLESLLA
ncbi:MAG: AAA family ATPase [Chroococcus sp. CMT-3BRIN-NPC107]|jgi:predicted kinase|nr:AAA family ATPase [Chroococcus sp. CMT-3BRIN-NPC107]